MNESPETPTDKLLVVGPSAMQADQQQTDETTLQLNPEAYKVTREDMEKITRETRRRVVIDLAKRMLKADYSPFIAPFTFDHTDVRSQRYIRMAETVFDWMTKR